MFTDSPTDAGRLRTTGCACLPSSGHAALPSAERAGLPFAWHTQRRRTVADQPEQGAMVVKMVVKNRR